MREILILLLAILANTHCSCPDGLELVRDGQCRGFIENMSMHEIEATETAISKCKAIDAMPVIIHNDEQQSYWTSKQIEKDNYLILGLVCNTTTTKWEWSDGSSVDYKPPPSSSDVTANCGNTANKCSWVMYGPAAWHMWCGKNKDPFSIFCTKQLKQPFPIENGCESFEDDSEDDICYQIDETAESWKEAQMTCLSFGGQLASIHNPQENSFIRRLAISRGALNGMFIGATISGKGNTFAWTDGSAWDYDNFMPGFPISGLGDCLAMDPQVANGQWVNVDCTANFSVACERSKKYTTTFDCPSGPWKEGQIIYSPGFPFDASMPCDFVLSVDAGKTVQVEILLLEANTCCDHLVLFDNYIGGKVIGNYTGEIRDKLSTTSTTNFMRVSWQPNGGVNVRGMMMTFRGV